MASGIEMWEEEGSEHRCHPNIMILCSWDWGQEGLTLLSLWTEAGQHDILGDILADTWEGARRLGLCAFYSINSRQKGPVNTGNWRCIHQCSVSVLVAGGCALPL